MRQLKGGFAGISSDGKRMLTVLEDKLILWHSENQEPLWTVESNPLPTYLDWYKKEDETVALSESGQLIIAVSNTFLRIWKLDNSKQLTDEKTYNGKLFLLSPNKDLVLTVLEDNTIRLWQVRNSKFSYLSLGYKEDDESIIFSPGGKLIGAFSEESSRIWQVNNGKLLGRLQTLSPDEEFVLTVENNILFNLWRIDNGELLYQWERYQEDIKEAQFDPSSKLLFLRLTDNTLHIFDMESRTSAYYELEKYGEAVLSIPDSQLMLLASENQILIWDTQSRTTLYQRNKQKDQKVTMARYSPNKQRLAIAFDDYSVLLWDIPSNKMGRVQHTDFIRSIVFSDDGEQVITTSDDKTAILWRSADFWQPTDNIIKYTQEKVWKTLAPQQREELLLHFLGITQEEWNSFENPEQRISYVWNVWTKFTLEQQKNLSFQVLRLLWQTTNWERVSLNQFRQLSAWLSEPLAEHNLGDQEKLPEYYNIPLLHRLEERWQDLDLAQQTQVLNQVVALT